MIFYKKKKRYWSQKIQKWISLQINFYSFLNKKLKVIDNIIYKIGILLLKL